MTEMATPFSEDISMKVFPVFKRRTYRDVSSPAVFFKNI